jgi:hypothetical protein
MQTRTRRLKEDQNFWNILFIIFFVGIACASLFYLEGIRDGLPHHISFFDAVLIVLAAFRITRLVVYDKISRFFREWFVQKQEVVRDDEVWVEIVPYARGFRASVYELLNCPWCIGMWSALIVIFCYYAFSWSWYLILLLAIAGASSFVQIVANAVGWKAENLKADSLLKEKDL